MDGGARDCDWRTVEEGEAGDELVGALRGWGMGLVDATFCGTGEEEVGLLVMESAVPVKRDRSTIAGALVEMGDVRIG